MAENMTDAIAYEVLKSGTSNQSTLDAAIEYYYAHGQNGLQTVKDLGYPSRTLLSQWVEENPRGTGKDCKAWPFTVAGGQADFSGSDSWRKLEGGCIHSKG